MQGLKDACENTLQDLKLQNLIQQKTVTVILQINNM